MNPKLSVLADARGGWFTRADAMDCGYSDSELRRRLRSGQWARLSRDVYLEPGASPAGETSWDRAKRVHLLKTRAVLNRLGPGAVASHQSAAVYEVGVVLGDAALHERLVSPEALVATADRHSVWHGSPAARAAARFANGLSESVGESRLRVLMANHGLPEPELQVEIRDASGRLIARVDILLERVCVVEFDGAMKYGNADDLVAEKWREDDLRSRGYQVVRVSWSDLDHPLTTANRIRQGLPSVGGAPTWRGR